MMLQSNGGEVGKDHKMTLIPRQHSLLALTWFWVSATLALSLSPVIFSVYKTLQLYLSERNLIAEKF